MNREIPIDIREKLRALRALWDGKIDEKERVAAKMLELSGGRQIYWNDPKKKEWLCLKERKNALTNETAEIKRQIRGLIADVAAEEKEDARTANVAGDMTHLRYPGWRSRISKKAISVEEKDEDDR